MPHKRLFRAALTLGLIGSAALAPSASAALDEVNTKRLRDAVTTNGILAHERALQQIANFNGGTRASGTPGYAASAAYVRGRLERAGYTVSEQELTFPFFRDLAPATLTVGITTYATGTLQYSGSGTVTGRVVPVSDNLIPPPATPAPPPAASRVTSRPRRRPSPRSR